MTKSFFLDQHGCAKNQVDGELIIGILTGLGWHKVLEPAEAELIIVNSCGFIEPAKRESIEAVVTARAAYPQAKILLAGCLAERYGEVFQTDFEEADAFFGNGDLSQLPQLIAKLFPEKNTARSTQKKASALRTPRPFLKPAQEGISCGARPELLNFPRSAFIKITEGCNNCCTFCAIPIIRGSVRSRPISSIVDEIRDFVQKGYKEFNLIGQDLAVYDAAADTPAGQTALFQPVSAQHRPVTGIRAPAGRAEPLSVQLGAAPGTAPTAADTKSVAELEARGAAAPVPAAPSQTKDCSTQSAQPDSSGLAQLLRAIAAIPGSFYVRLLYIHPDHFPPDILPIMAADTRFLPYFDIPFQSGSESIIHAMNRCGSAAAYLEMVETIRAAFRKAESPYGEAVIRTTFLTGFPGETEEDFEQTAAFLQAVQSLWSGAFVYSREEGTKAARMKKRVPAKVAEQRKSRLNELQLHITEQKLAAFCGKEVLVLIEEVIPQAQEDAQTAPPNTGAAANPTAHKDSDTGKPAESSMHSIQAPALENTQAENTQAIESSGAPTSGRASSDSSYEEPADTRIALGRAWFQAPEVDGAIVVNFSETQKDTEGHPIQPGSLVRVRITALRGIDLEADVLND